MAFAKPLEAEFRAAHRESVRRWIRLSLLIALSTVLGFAVIDHWVLAGPRVPQSDLVRFGLHLPMVLVMMVLTADRFYDRWYQPAIQIAAPLFALGTVYMATQATPEQLPLIVGRLVLATFFFYFMLGLSFTAALRSNVVLIAGYGVAPRRSAAIAPDVAIYQLFVLLLREPHRRRGLLCARACEPRGVPRSQAAHGSRHARWPDGPAQPRGARRAGAAAVAAGRARRRSRSPWCSPTSTTSRRSTITTGIRRAISACAMWRTRCSGLARRRPLDLVARYGGEEFIAVLIGADRAHAEHVARSVREAVARAADSARRLD